MYFYVSRAVVRYLLLTSALLLVHANSSHASDAFSTQQTLQLGSEQAPVTALYQPPLGAIERGTLIFFANPTDPHGNKLGFSRLRTQLSHQGYASYLVVSNANLAPNESEAESEQSEEQSDADKSEASAPDEQSAKSEGHYFADYQSEFNEARLDAQKKLLEQQLDSVMGHIGETTKPVTLIASGINAGLLSEYLASFPDLPVGAFVGLGTYLPEPERHKHISAHLSVLYAPVLDIYAPDSHRWAWGQQQSRALWAAKNHKAAYRQRDFFASLGEPRQSARLAKEIDGFLRRLF